MRAVVYSTLFNLVIIAVNAAVPRDSSVKDTDESMGCSYRGNFYNSGMKIKSQDPCVYCMCESSTLQCTLELCSTYSTIPSGCKLVSKPGKCCQELVCDKTASKTTPPKTQLKQGCTVGQNNFKDGEAIPSTDPCQQCYCLQNQTQCITQECLLPPDVVLNCEPVIEKEKCCPVRYHCQNGNDHQTIEVPSGDFIATSKPPAKLVTTTTATITSSTGPGGRKLPDDQNGEKSKDKAFFNETGCQDAGHWYKNGDKVPRGNDPCMSCICQKDGVVCTMVQCRELPTGVSACKQARDNQCCPSANNCTCTFNLNEPYARSYEPTTCDSCSYNGTIYPLGARIHTLERCQVCLCRDSGIYCLGRTECDDPPQRLTAFKSCKPFYNDDLDSCCPMAYDCLDSKNNIKRILVNGKENGDYEENNVTSTGRIGNSEDSEIPIISPVNSNTKVPSDCEVEGKKFKFGELIPMGDPCLHCKCNTDGAVTCSRSTCRKLPFGVSQCAPVTGQCCPDWKNCTCSYSSVEFHVAPLKDIKCTQCVSNRHNYKLNQKLQTDNSCFTCTCLETGIMCQKINQCLNEMSAEDIKIAECTPVYGDDKCCPIDYNCAKGPSVEGRVLRGPATPIRGNRVRPRHRGCVHGGITYQINEELPKTDPCSTCVCDANGTVACVSMQCQRQPVGVTNCKRIQESNICCPTLVDCSCFHLADAPEGRTYTDVTCGTCLVRNRRYRPGDIVPSHDPCSQCECTEHGVMCESVIECEPPPHDACTPIFDGTQCCPTQYECGRFNNRGKNTAISSLHMQNTHSLPNPGAQPIVFPNAPHWPPMTTVSRPQSNRDSDYSSISGRISEQPSAQSTRSKTEIPDDNYYDYYDEEVTTPAPAKKPSNKKTTASVLSYFNHPCIIGSSSFEHNEEISVMDPCVHCRCINSNIRCQTLCSGNSGGMSNRFF